MRGLSVALGFAVLGCGHGNVGFGEDAGGGPGGGGHPGADAFVECSYRPPESQICPNTCGNGAIDTCYVGQMETSHCTLWYPYQEACDTTPPSGQTCDSLGYYGGTLGCSPACTGPDARACGVCAPSITCVTPLYGGLVLSVSGNHVASLGPQNIQFYVGTTPTTQIAVQAFGIAATDAGWLIRDAAGLETLAFDGTLGPGVASTDEVGPGPGNRLTGVRDNNARMEIQLLDQAGAAVTPSVDVFAWTNRYGVATDGVHSFVGGLGTLAVLALDGSVTTVTGFPTDDAVAVTWDGTTGWYVTGTSAQRFDSHGALVGAPIALPNPAGNALADGADLVAVVGAGIGSRFAVQRIHADGGVEAPVEIGAGAVVPVAIARIAGQIVINWNTTSEAPLALVP